MLKIEAHLRTPGRFSSLATSHGAIGRSAETMMRDEVLVVDDRSDLSPAQAVENRLARMLSEATMPISHLQMRGILRTR